MAERSSITQSVQIGVEVTPGTAVAANRRLGSLGFKFGPQTESKKLRPTGTKYPAAIIQGKEWSEADLEGMPVYTELPYAYASVIATPTVSQIMDDTDPTGAYRWLFSSNTFADDVPKTYTVEQGSSYRAHRAAHGLITEYGWEWSREEIEVGGTMLARAIEDGVTLTSSPTSLAQIPVRPAELSVYLDATDATDLGTTKLTRVLKGEFNIEDRFGPLWVVDAAQASFVSAVEGEPTIEFKMTQMANAEAMANLTRMRTGATAWLRLQGQGPVIYTPSVGDPIRHSVTIDVAAQVEEPSTFEDEDGVYAIEWTFHAVHDIDWGKAFQVEVITTTSAL